MSRNYKFYNPKGVYFLTVARLAQRIVWPCQAVAQTKTEITGGL